MSNLSITDASTLTVEPSLVVEHPRYSRIFIAASTSLSIGQLCITLTEPVIKVPANIGNALFFAP